ncbi:hypothetical protein OJ996_16595 [Luteolibacter sp. GHJ8]|uniref:Uncharacterized protein n=1 Tax=Luteolibacter rhizosphaerae TaxID=2989719 RepID=A0ABT3G5T7_9BACT|nr:hypothetical protein [Luteolibacter rhizosphaerae]MCW1915207.1 hypothetical protein [Luteolibacter rhizosphaerae]
MEDRKPVLERRILPRRDVFRMKQEFSPLPEISGNTCPLGKMKGHSKPAIPLPENREPELKYRTPDMATPKPKAKRNKKNRENAQ